MPATYRLHTLNLNRLVVNHDLTLQDILIDDLLARRLVCKGQTEFKNIVFKQEVDLQDSNFLAVKFSEVSWPEKSGAVNLSGLTYQTISGESEASILAWLNKAQFEAQNYTTYQKYLEKINKADWADKVFIAMKRREWGGQTWKEWLNPIHWPLLLLWDLPVGYGRKPQNIFWVGLPLIIFGAIVLDPKYLEGIQLAAKEQMACKLVGAVASRAWISLPRNYWNSAWMIDGGHQNCPAPCNFFYMFSD